MSRRKTSLSLEVNLIARSIDAMRILSEKWKELHFTEEELPRLAHAMHATLVLVRERLVLLDRGIRDTLDPRHLSCPENEAFEAQPGDDGDAILRAWPPKKEAEKLRKEADRAEHRLQVLRERRQAKEAR